jgi:phosphatidylserine decarboxylase
MVRDGFFYALGLAAVAVLLGVLATPWLAVAPLLLALFFLWFFRDPEREIPSAPGLVVSPADGKVTEVAPVQGQYGPATRISIFLSVFDVHVNRAPVSGVLTASEYRRGKYLNAMDPASAELNEQNVCTLLTDGGQRVVFKQIAGLLARRIVFTPEVGQRLERGERIGLIKFGSRCDLILPASARVLIQVGQRVKGGSSQLAILAEEQGGAG